MGGEGRERSEIEAMVEMDARGEEPVNGGSRLRGFERMLSVNTLETSESSLRNKKYQISVNMCGHVISR